MAILIKLPKINLLGKIWDFTGGSVAKNPPPYRGPEFDPWVRQIPWRRKRQPIQYSCLGKHINRGAWWATVHGVKKD